MGKSKETRPVKVIMVMKVKVRMVGQQTLVVRYDGEVVRTVKK